MFRVFGKTFFFLLLSMVTMLQCTPPRMGGSLFGVSTAALSGSDVTRVTVKISGPGISPTIVQNLTNVDGKWTGETYDIPAGSDRVFEAFAYNSSDNLVYKNKVSGISVELGVRIVVLMMLRSKQTSDPFFPTAPVLDGLVASRDKVLAGGKVRLQVFTHENNPEAQVSVSWSAEAGAHQTDTSHSSDWTAPLEEGHYDIAATLTDKNGSQHKLGYGVYVGSARRVIQKVRSQQRNGRFP